MAPAGPMWEMYLTDPATEPDPAKWRIDIYYPSQQHKRVQAGGPGHPRSLEPREARSTWVSGSRKCANQASLIQAARIGPMLPSPTATRTIDSTSKGVTGEACQLPCRGQGRAFARFAVRLSRNRSSLFGVGVLQRDAGGAFRIMTAGPSARSRLEVGEPAPTAAS
jgi:hypothetical protein